MSAGLSSWELCPFIWTGSCFRHGWMQDQASTWGSVETNWIQITVSGVVCMFELHRNWLYYISCDVASRAMCFATVCNDVFSLWKRICVDFLFPVRGHIPPWKLCRGFYDTLSCFQLICRGQHLSDLWTHSLCSHREAPKLIQFDNFKNRRFQKF